MTGTLVSVVKKTTAGALKLKELVAEGELFFFVINVKDHATEFKFDDVYDSCHLLNDSIMCAIDVLIAGKSVLVCGYGGGRVLRFRCPCVWWSCVPWRL